MKQDKYIFFTKNSNIVYNLENLNDLKTHYLKICNQTYVESGQAEIDFLKEFEDGYIIINHNDGEDILYFIDCEKIDNIFKDLENQTFILNILKEKLKSINNDNFINNI